MKRASRAILVLAIVGGAFAAFSGSAQAGVDVTLRRSVFDRTSVCKILPRACIVIKFSPPVDECTALVAAYADVLPTTANRDNVEKATVCLVNQKRVEASVPQVLPDTALRDGARTHGQWLADNDHFCHAPGIRENLHWGTNTSARGAVTAWMNSPAHHDMMLDIGWPTAQYVGVGVTIGSPDPAWSSGSIFVMRMSPNGTGVYSTNDCPS